MDSRFRYEVSHVVMNCRDPQESLRALRALGACREHGDLLLYVPFRLSNSSPLSFGSNLQQATQSIGHVLDVVLPFQPLTSSKVDVMGQVREQRR